MHKITGAETSVYLCRAHTQRQALSAHSLDPHHSLCGSYCYYLHFTQEEMEAQRALVTCPRSHSWDWQSQNPNWPRAYAFIFHIKHHQVDELLHWAVWPWALLPSCCLGQHLERNPCSQDKPLSEINCHPRAEWRGLSAPGSFHADLEHIP